MDAKLFCNKTISAASRAISVHPCTTIPTWAALIASTSLIPSPRKPTEYFFCKVRIIRYFSSGATRANTWQRSTTSSNSSCDSVLRVRPKITSFLDTTIPASWAITPATSNASPVINFTCTLRSAASLSAAFTVGLSGSVKAIKPTRRHSSFSLHATAITRRPNVPCSIAHEQSWCSYVSPHRSTTGSRHRA